MNRTHTFFNLLLLLGVALTLTACTAHTPDKSTCVNDHRFIDLQLPSGLLWAETNIGADTPTDYGAQYAWGETQTKTDYSQATYRYGTDFDKMTRYCDADHKTTLVADDDVAATLWGNGCRMPTYEELQELGDTTNCRWTFTEKRSPKGYRVKGYEVKSVRNGNSIFLPSAGAHNGKNFFREDGLYWTSSLAPRSNGEAFCLYFNLGHYSYYMNDRSLGASVRPVLGLKTAIN